MVELGRRERGDAARKFEYLGMCKLEGRREIESARLRLNGLPDGLAAMARIGAPQARRGVQNGRSVGLVIIHVLRAGEQARLALELAVRRKGQPEGFKIIGGGFGAHLGVSR